VTSDRLLEVDGSNLRGVTHQQAVECLKRTGEPTVILETRPDSPCPPLVHSPSHTQSPRTEVSVETTLSGRAKDYSFVTDENTHEVVLKKSLSGLGFSFYISQLHSGPDHGSFVRIKRLFPGQPALESGLLREGDIILSVNKEPDTSTSFVCFQRVLFLLRGAPSEVHLLICRPGPGSLLQIQLSWRSRRIWTVKCHLTRHLRLLLAHHPHRRHLRHLHHPSHQRHLPRQHHPPHRHLALHQLHQNHDQRLGIQGAGRRSRE
uniref:FERM and PDZ domain containing 2 n=1 Tax=Echeneis naucrates TaxID=173247 RepID=A0A665UVF9_ECHNA